MFGSRIPFVVLNVLSVPLALQLDIPGIVDWYILLSITVVCIALLAAAAVFILICAGLQSFVATPQSVYSCRSRKVVIASLLAFTTILAIVWAFVALEARAQLYRGGIRDPKAIVLPFCISAMMLAVHMWITCLVIVPPWRTDFANITGVPTPTTAAERREHLLATDVESASQAVCATPAPRPKHLYRVSHHLYRRYTEQDGPLSTSSAGNPMHSPGNPSIACSPSLASTRSRVRLAWLSPRAQHRPSMSTPQANDCTTPGGDIMSPDSQRLCRLCFTNEANAVILECGHGGICMVCGLRIKQGNTAQRLCPMCRTKVDMLVRIKPPRLQRSSLVEVIEDSDEDRSVRPRTISE